MEDPAQNPIPLQTAQPSMPVNTPVSSPVEQPVEKPLAEPQEQEKSTQNISKIIILIGVVIVLVALAVIAYMTFLKPKETLPVSTIPVQPTPQELTLVLVSPVDEALAVEDEILVSGTTLPNATVAIYTESDETSLEADATGAFETTVQLSPGINSLNVTSFTNDGQEKTVSLNVIYDNE
jgi:hypothetical protein